MITNKACDEIKSNERFYYFQSRRPSHYQMKVRFLLFWVRSKGVLFCYFKHAKLYKISHWT